jgi:NADH-quinone oxidoreductase subunit C
MDDQIKVAGKALRERFAALDYRECIQPSCFCVTADQLVVACQMLRDEYKFNFLADITAVDYWPEVEPRFHVVYQLYSYAHNARISLRVALNSEAFTMSTIEGLYPNANWYERELWDMFGIHVEDTPVAGF